MDVVMKYLKCIDSGIHRFFYTVLTGQFPFIIITMFAGLLISSFDIIIIQIKGTPLIYPYIVSYGSIGFIVAFFAGTFLIPFIILSIIGIMFFDNEQFNITIEVKNQKALNYFVEQSIFLRDDEKIIMSVYMGRIWNNRVTVLTNKRIFEYENEQIIWQIYLSETDKIMYKNKAPKRWSFHFFLKNGTIHRFKLPPIWAEAFLERLNKIFKVSQYDA